MRMKWSTVRVSITSMPVMSMIAQRALFSTTACSSALVISLLRAVSIKPTTGTHSTPSQTSMIGVESSWIATFCCSMVASFSSSSRW